MKQVLAFFIVLLVMASCTGNQSVSNSGSMFEQYKDSITKVYPNYKGNIAVLKQISDDFEKHLGTMPGILEGTEFSFTNIADVGGKLLAAFSYKYKGDDVTSLSVYCEDLDPQLAATLSQDKTYKITGGTFDHYQAERGMAQQWLTLGTIYVRDLKVEEY